MKPLIVINLKTYQQGKGVLKLCKKIERVDKNIIVGCGSLDICRVSEKTKLKVYCQHVDYFEEGRNTGFILPEGIKGYGAVGVFLNHSEHPLAFDIIKKSIVRCHNVGLKVMVFAKDLKMAKRFEKLRADYVVIEPPELVAGKISVSEARPDLIEKIGKSLKCKFLVGAGIHSKKDVEIAMKFGACGVALSSAITTSLNPEKVLKGLVSNA